LLITATAGVNQKLSPRVHFSREAVVRYALRIATSIISTNSSGIGRIPFSCSSNTFDDLLQYILKIDEITNLDSSQIEHEASVRKPLYLSTFHERLLFDMHYVSQHPSFQLIRLV
jgi:hypothetical protein